MSIFLFHLILNPSAIEDDLVYLSCSARDNLEDVVEEDMVAAREFADSLPGDRRVVGWYPHPKITVSLRLLRVVWSLFTCIVLVLELYTIYRN